MNIDTEIEVAKTEMATAEDALMLTGFPEDQWMLVKEYLASAMRHHGLHVAKMYEEDRLTVQRVVS